MRFWDSSALVPLIVAEAHSEVVQGLVAEDPEMMVWWASPVECASAVHRLRRQGLFDAVQAGQILKAAALAFDAANAVQAGDALGAKALRLLGVHPLRAADALQLAAALLAHHCVDPGHRHVEARRGFPHRLLDRGPRVGAGNRHIRGGGAGATAEQPGHEEDRNGENQAQAAADRAVLSRHRFRPPESVDITKPIRMNQLDHSPHGCS